MSIPLTCSGLFPRLNMPGSYYQSASHKIHDVTDQIGWCYEVPDIGTDQFLVSKGKWLGTTGLATCFAICSIGKTNLGTPVLGLCHKSSVVSVEHALQKLKNAMIDREGALKETIETYIVGGEQPSEDNEGTLEEENTILAMAEKENIQGVLFNVAQGEEDGLSVVLTPKNVYVSKNLLFPETEWDAGENL